MQRLAVITALVLAGCGDGMEGPASYGPSLPQPGERPRTPTTVALGNPGDHWLETMQYVRVERAASEGQYGYAVTYEVPGSDTGDTFVLFWPRAQIEFTAGSRRVTPSKLVLGSEQVMYPDTITASSLPDVHRAILMLETWYAKEADGAIEAMEGFVVVVSMGPGPRIVRTPRGPPPPARPAVPTARVAASKFKPFTERNFRENLIRLTGGQPKGAHAHHVLPRKHADKFGLKQINIHDPQYGAWWPANKHLSAAKAYNQRWDKFFSEVKNPSVDQIFQFARKVAKDYGLNLYF